ncbi:pectinesterase inhibitor 10-like [Telopea speciosissima]|uniref:pectinesterase inhibitor 10-like n=1 Tax=Telopea speciosissima TaxID=54955 RepID=UPI001CC5063A|nr:pectinesterase inhibitor 10-like [Telopea speciosissima]
MEHRYLNRLLLIVSLSSLFSFLYSAEAICVPRNFTKHVVGLPHKLPPFSVSSPRPKPPSSTPPPPTPASSSASPPPPTKHHQVTPATPSVTNPSTNSVVDPEVNKICHATDYPDLCLSSLRPYLHGKTDLLTILEDEIKACKDRAIAVSAVAQKKSHDPKANINTTSIATDCKDMFSDALANFQEAEDAIKVRDIGTVNSMLSAALTYVDDCDDEISDNRELQQLLSRQDVTLKDLTSNCLAIVSLIKY